MGSLLSSEFVTISPKDGSYPPFLKRKEYREKEATASLFSHISLDSETRERVEKDGSSLSEYLRDHVHVDISLPSPKEREILLPERCPLHITSLLRLVQEYAREAYLVELYGSLNSISLGNLRSILMEMIHDKGYVKSILRDIVLYGFVRDLRGVRREVDSTILFVGGLFDVVLSSLSLDDNTAFRDLLAFIGIRMERGRHTGRGWVKDAMHDITILHAYSSEGAGCISDTFIRSFGIAEYIPDGKSEILPEALIRVCTPSVILSYILAGSDEISRADLSLLCMSLAVKYDRPKHLSAIFKKHRHSRNCNYIMAEILLLTNGNSEQRERGERLLQEAITSGLAMCDVLSHIDDGGDSIRLTLSESTRRIREYVERHCIILGGMREDDVRGAVVTLRGGVWYHQFPKTGMVNIYRLLYILHSRFPTENSGYTATLHRKSDARWYPVCTTHSPSCGIIKDCKETTTRVVRVVERNVRRGSPRGSIHRRTVWDEYKDLMGSSCNREPCDCCGSRSCRNKSHR